MKNTILSKLQEYFLGQNLNDIKYDKNLDINKLSIPEIWNNLDWKHLLENPPENNSQQTYDELIEISKITASITDRDKQMILVVDKDPVTLFTPVMQRYGIEFPQKIFDEIYKPTYDLIKIIKIFYNRPRPQQLAKKLKIPINVITTKTHQTPSYPSGHTAYAKLAQELIHFLYPQVERQFTDRSVDIVSEARIKQGVHYRSDIIAAQKLIPLIFPTITTHYGSILHL